MSQTVQPSPGPPRATPGPNSYTTLRAGADFRHELVIKRSRFITVLRRVDEEPSARALVAELRKEFYDARHHCSAFVIGPGRDLQRSHDDGEPSGTAGTPMLDALVKRETRAGDGVHSADLSDVCAVVVRYFGGILLGAGGLVRAYSESVSKALELAPLVSRDRLKLFTVAVPHAAAGRLENDLRSAGYLMTGNNYDALNTHVGLAIADDDLIINTAVERLAALSAGRCTLATAGTDWVDTPLDRA
ncbi:IMPACT family protein [Arthrobacter psychrochitiniphilus]|uniref:YigZ family protein n=1 Tax=Arthrobacter psychrochitiniphilus TaxID=291045 RepID=A0A2V3DQN0_9MICC|nr:YigZ family protein [Arthrobacter psychrochitiniphilus]NYG17614.1 putative YigZ family protein [Arthrobacter psychrochitiniphilus]PXA65312.1 YigZ family protein [Arthrobacter psychrochitiniphilus]